MCFSFSFLLLLLFGVYLCNICFTFCSIYSRAFCYCMLISYLIFFYRFKFIHFRNIFLFSPCNMCACFCWVELSLLLLNICVAFYLLPPFGNSSLHTQLALTKNEHLSSFSSSFFFTSRTLKWHNRTWRVIIRRKAISLYLCETQIPLYCTLTVIKCTQTLCLFLFICNLSYELLFIFSWRSLQQMHWNNKCWSQKWGVGAEDRKLYE